MTGSSVTIKVEEEQSANQEQSHTTENVGYMALFTPESVLPPPPEATRGTVEYGDLTLDQDELEVTLTEEFVNPVIIMGVLSSNGADPSTVRVSDVTPTSFKVQVQEWDYLDGEHTTETVSYMVLEAGHWPCPNGGTYSAGVATVGANWQTIEYGDEFETPVVFSSIVTDETGQPMVTRQKAVNNNNFKVRLQAEEADQVPGQEQVSWLVLDTNSEGLRYVGKTDNVVTHEGTPINFGSFNHGNPGFFAAMQTFNGPDTATLRYNDMSETSATVIVEEEQSANEEQAHTTEVVGYMAIWQPEQAGTAPETRPGSRPIQADQAMVEFGNIVLSHETFHVELENTFVNPVVILGALSYNGGDPSTVRVWNV
jgi:hypothetical protein